MIDEQRAASTYRRDIDGLRAIAVTSVVLYHAGLPFLPSGFVGVDIFFVISGFLISGILNREIRSGTFTFKGFYARRAKRIAPALIVVLTVFCITCIFLMGSHELMLAARSAISAILGLSNLYFWWTANYFAPTSHYYPFLMTWSLGVEEQFYVVLPFLFIVLSRYSQRIAIFSVAALTISSFIVCAILTLGHPTFAFYLLPTRAWELGVGSLLALLWGNHRLPQSEFAHNILGSAGFLFTCIACIAYTDATPFPGLAAAMPVFGAAALIFSEKSWVNRNILSSSPMVGIGLISYSWYLWHAPLIALVRLSSFGTADLRVMSAVVIFSLLIAYLSYRFVEKPFRHIKIGDAIAVRRFGIAMLACILLPATLFASNGLPQRFNTQQRLVETALAVGRANPCLVSYGITGLSEAADCLGTKERLNQDAVALLGDSHGAAIGNAMRELVHQQGRDFIQLEKSSCAPIFGAVRNMRAYPTHGAECAKYNEEVFQKIANDPRIKIVVLAGFWGASFQNDQSAGQLIATRTDNNSMTQVDLLRQSLNVTLARYQQAGKTVIVVGDVPLMRFDPGKEALTDILPFRAALREMLSVPHDVANGITGMSWVRPATVADHVVREVVLSNAAARYIDLADRLCRDGQCRYSKDLPFYIDFQHLSEIGAEFALKDFKL